MTNFVHRLAPRSLHPDDVAAAHRCLLAGRYTQGETVRAFERELERWTGIPHMVAVNSGSSALLLAAHWLFRKDGDDPMRNEVLVPALCWSTDAWAFLQMGATPIMVDVDPETIAMDLRSAEAALTTHTKALVLIHVLGRAAPTADYQAFCREHDLALIEDCCESFGAHDEGMHVGSSGLLSCFSFYYSHHLTTIEGGAVACLNDVMADEIREARAHGWARDRVHRPSDPTGFEFVSDGFNLRMTEPQAAIGLSQLSRLSSSIANRRNAAYEIVWNCNCPHWLDIPGRLHASPEQYPIARDKVQHSWMFVPIMLTADAPCSRGEVVATFQKHGVETRPIIAGNLARHPAAAGRVTTPVPLPVADAIHERGLLIGCPPDASEEGISAVAAACCELAKLF